MADGSSPGAMRRDGGSRAAYLIAECMVDSHALPRFIAPYDLTSELCAHGSAHDGQHGKHA
jgi:hypothetical protein